MYSSSSSYSSSSTAFYSSPSSQMISSTFSLAHTSVCSTPSYPLSIGPYSETPLELTASSSSSSRRKTSKPKRVAKFQLQQSMIEKASTSQVSSPDSLPATSHITKSPQSLQWKVQQSLMTQVSQPQSEAIQNQPLSLVTYPSTIEPLVTSLQEVNALEAENKTPVKKKKASPVPDSLKTAEYWLRRKKNNESAKRSRDAKKAHAEWVEKRLVELQEHLFWAQTENKCLTEEIERLTNLMKPKISGNVTQ